MATREELHQLVSSLPDGALDAAHAALMQVQSGPPPADLVDGLEHFRQAQQRVHERMQERMRELAEQLARRKPGR
jgi:uncharacterized protein Yka (UPF0111/DUF47 family)